MGQGVLDPRAPARQVSGSHACPACTLCCQHRKGPRMARQQAWPSVRCGRPEATQVGAVPLWLPLGSVGRLSSCASLRAFVLGMSALCLLLALRPRFCVPAWSLASLTDVHVSVLGGVRVALCPAKERVSEGPLVPVHTRAWGAWGAVGGDRPACPLSCGALFGENSS